MIKLERSVLRSQHPVKNMFVQAASTRSRSVCRTRFTIDPYPRRCWLKGPVKPMGLCWSVPSPATREMSMLARWSFAVILSAFVETLVLLLITIATYRCPVVWEHVDVAIQIFKA